MMKKNEIKARGRRRSGQKKPSLIFWAGLAAGAFLAEASAAANGSQFSLFGAGAAHSRMLAAERECAGEIAGDISDFYMRGDSSLLSHACFTEAQRQQANASFLVKYWRYRRPGSPHNPLDLIPAYRDAAIKLFEALGRPLTDIPDGEKSVPKDFDFCEGVFLPGSASYRYDYLAVQTESGEIGIVRPKRGASVCGILKPSIGAVCSSIKILDGGKLAVCQNGAISRLINIPSEFIYHGSCHTIKFLDDGRLFSCKLGASISFTDIETGEPVSFSSLPAAVRELVERKY